MGTGVGGIHHVALRVADCSRAAAFYSGVLGLPELRRFLDSSGAVRSVWLAAGDAVVMLERVLRGGEGQEGTGHVLALAVDDLGSWAARLAAAGVPVIDRTEYTLSVKDPDGHRLGLTVFGRTRP